MSTQVFIRTVLNTYRRPHDQHERSDTVATSLSLTWRFTAPSSSCSTASASASCPTRRRTATRAATRSATSRSAGAAAGADAARARAWRASAPLGERRRRSRRCGACRTHGRSVGRQGLGHRPLGDDGHRARPAVSGVSGRLLRRRSSRSSRAGPAAACSATRRRRARRSSTSSAPSTCAPAR